jgi:hypothetical protein
LWTHDKRIRGDWGMIHTAASLAAANGREAHMGGHGQTETAGVRRVPVSG